MAVVAYVGGTVAVVYQIAEFATGFLNLPSIGLPYNALTTAVVAFVGLTAGAWCSYVNAHASARTMLIAESLSMAAITVLMIIVLVTHHGPIVDPVEFKGFSLHSIVLGIPLVLFSFSGFESATAFAREAKNPRRMITLALMGSITRHLWPALAAGLLAAAALVYLLYKSFVPLPPFPTSVFVYVLFAIVVLSVLVFPLVAARRAGLRQLGSSVTEYDIDEGAADSS